MTYIMQSQQSSSQHDLEGRHHLHCFHMASRHLKTNFGVEYTTKYQNISQHQFLINFVIIFVFCVYLVFLPVPGEPRKIKLEAVNSTAINAQWRPPADQTGIIRGYQVYYVQVNDNDELVGSPASFDAKDGSKMEVTITGLQPDTNYQFQIAAYTRKGDGEISKPRKAKTKGAGKNSLSETMYHL